MSMNDWRETYGLWWEYGNRSALLKEIYKQFKGKSIDQVHAAIISKATSPPSTIEQQKNTTKEIFQLCLYGLYKDFFEKNKDEFIASKLIEEKPRACISGIGNPEYIRGEMLKFKNSIRAVLGTEPTLDQFIDLFSHIYTSDIFECRITVRPHGSTLKQIMAELEEILSPVLAENKSHQSIHRQFSGPTQPVDHEKLRDYLTVYDLFESEATAEDVITAFYSGTNKDVDPDYENKRRSIYRYHERAKRIIKNVENGIFPGVYKSAPSDTPRDQFRVT